MEKLKQILAKAWYEIRVWGKGAVRTKINSDLKPMLETELKQKGVTKKSIECILEVVDNFTSKYL